MFLAEGHFMYQDLRYALRLMWKAPAFTLVAVATLALGIGANAAIFSVVNAALIAPLPFPHADRLVAVWTTVKRETLERRAASYPDFRDLRDRTRAFDAIAAWSSDSGATPAPGRWSAWAVLPRRFVNTSPAGPAG